MSERVLLVGGIHDRRRVEMSETPRRIMVGLGSYYVRVDDPDSGAFLGCYVHEGGTHERPAHPEG